MYHNKYQKYIIKINQIGGAIVDINGIEIDHMLLTILTHDNNKILATRHRESGGKLAENPQYNVLGESNEHDYIIKINKGANPVIAVTKSTKELYIYLNNAVCKIHAPLLNFDESYYKTENANVEIGNDAVKLSGICTIRKPSDIEIMITIQKINDYPIETIQTDLLKMKNIFSYERFDYELAYDEFRSAYLERFCKKSKILLKNMYNSVFNLFTVNNIELYNLLKNNYGKILKMIITEKLLSIESKINTVCNNDEDRHMMLQNIMKRIETTNKNVIIKNSAGEYVNLPNECKIVFDTGNSASTIVGKNIVDALGIVPIKIFKYSGSGIGGSVDYSLGYAPLTIKFNETSTYYLPHEYKINAIVDDNNLKNTLLIGHSSNIFTDMFRNNYCVGYNLEKSEAVENVKAEDIVANLDEIIYLQERIDVPHIRKYSVLLYKTMSSIYQNKEHLLNFGNIQDIYQKTKIIVDKWNLLKTFDAYKFTIDSGIINMIDNAIAKLI